MSRPTYIILFAVALSVVAIFVGRPAVDVLTNTSEDFEDGHSESAAAEERLAEATGAKPEPEVIAPRPKLRSIADRGRGRPVARRFGRHPGTDVSGYRRPVVLLLRVSVLTLTPARRQRGYEKTLIDHLA